MQAEISRNLNCRDEKLVQELYEWLQGKNLTIAQAQGLLRDVDQRIRCVCASVKL